MNFAAAWILSMGRCGTHLLCLSECSCMAYIISVGVFIRHHSRFILTLTHTLVAVLSKDFCRVHTSIPQGFHSWQPGTVMFMDTRAPNSSHRNFVSPLLGSPLELHSCPHKCQVCCFSNQSILAPCLEYSNENLDAVGKDKAKKKACTLGNGVILVTKHHCSLPEWEDAGISVLWGKNWRFLICSGHGSPARWLLLVMTWMSSDSRTVSYPMNNAYTAFFKTFNIFHRVGGQRKDEW